METSKYDIIFKELNRLQDEFPERHIEFVAETEEAEAINNLRKIVLETSEVPNTFYTTT